MNKYILFLIVQFIYLNTNAQSPEKEFPKSVTIKVSNPLATARENVLVFVEINQIKKSNSGFNAKSFIVMDGKTEVPSQINLHDNDYQGVVFVLDKLGSKESREIVLRYNPTGSFKHDYPKRTQAELSHKMGGEWKNREYIGGIFKNVEYLRVPPEHKDHSWFIRYEGPGWESDKVGYRFYLDQRNATDVFGKLTTEMVLQNAGLDGFDSYHNIQPWGMDVMKVGKSLGLGSIGSVVNDVTTRVELTDSVNCRIVENGAVYSSILTNYYGWKVGDKKHDVNSRLVIHAGTRVTQQLLTVSNAIENISTGIVKDKTAPLISSKGDSQRFGYIATYGVQSLNSDGLGLAVFYNPQNLIQLTEDENSHIIKLKPDQGKLTYHFLSTWEKEPGGIKDEKQFHEYLTQVASELANPVVVEFNKK
jgi:hypothetical protein